MNIKAAYRYQIDDNKFSTIIYYLIIVCIYVFLYSSMAITLNANDSTTITGQFSGIELATAIFAFVAGLNSFKEIFRMLMQNGISRKTLFISRCYTVITYAAIMAVSDKLLYIIFKGLSLTTDGSLEYLSLYELIYCSKPTQLNDLGFHIMSLLFQFTLYLAAMAVGYLIRLIEYRLNRLGRIALNVSVPVLLVLVLPIFDSSVTNGRIFTTLGNVFQFCYGFTTKNSLCGALTQALMFLAFSFFSWLLIRRAPIKDTE